MRTVAAWAADRPVIASVSLFGERLFARRDRNAPVRIAVQYDDGGMMDGFDDWIEQLRTNFAGLIADLSEPAVVLTPENGSKWREAVGGTELPAFAAGKVRLVVAPAPSIEKSEPSSPRIGLAMLRTWRPWP